MVRGGHAVTLVRSQPGTTAADRPTGRAWIVGVVALFVASGLAVAFTPVVPHGAVAQAPTHGASVLALSHASATAKGAYPTVGPSSGRGIFFNNTPLPTPAFGNLVCYVSYCYNTTTEPSMNYTSTGLLALAYTAITNATSCAQVANYTVSEIGFTTSTNLGATWSSPTYVGNPDCAATDEFPDAWDPSLTSLANGTLAMVYLETNYSTVSYQGPYVPPTDSCEYTPYNRLVVSESYNGGVTWSDPTVLNNSSTPLLPFICTSGANNQRPDITAIGDTLYVAWQNTTNRYDSVEVHLLVSTDGGASWGTQVDIPTMEGYDPTGYSGSQYGSYTNISENPSIVVGPTGELYLAYALNRTSLVEPYYDSFGNEWYGLEAEELVLSTSTDNGTTWTTHVAVPMSFVHVNGNFNSRMDNPAPAIAFDDATGAILMVYSNVSLGLQCYYYGCYSESDPNVDFVQSTDDGATWTAPMILGTAFSNPENLTSALYNPAIAVGTNGVIHVAMTTIDGNLCGNDSYGYLECGGQGEVYVNSTDGGTTFSPGTLVWYNYTPTQSAGYPDLWDGEKASVIATGGNLWIAWTHATCPGWNSSVSVYCDYPDTYGYDSPGLEQIVISSPFTGVGVTLTFVPTGLAAGDVWNVTVNGNYREGYGTTSLSVSGVPPGETMQYTVPYYNESYGHEYVPTVTPSSPTSFLVSSTITVSFAEYWLLGVTTNPPSCSNYYCYSWMSYEVSSGTGSRLVPANTTVYLNLTPTPSTTCCIILNSTFLGWTGTGTGSVSSTAFNISLTPASVINETANFVITGWCESYGPCGNLTYPATFNEQGLPANVAWGLSLNGIPETTTSPSIGLSEPPGFVYFTPWTIPDPLSPGMEWVGVADTASPLVVPHFAPVNITYSLVSTTSQAFSTVVQEVGLPSGTPWSVTLGSTSYGVAGTTLNLTLSGGAQSFATTSVETTSGVGYYASSVEVSEMVENSSTISGSTEPVTVALNGPTIVTFVFAPQYLVTVSPTMGGTVSAGTTWVHSGGSLTLTETPGAGYYFVGWTGVGSGASTTAQAHLPTITVTPKGPVTEVATFAPVPALTWTVDVSATGIPSDVAYTVTLGGLTYSGAGSFSVTNLSTGWYAVSALESQANATAPARYSPTGFSGSLSVATNGSALVDANATLVIAYAAQYLVNLETGPNGAIGPSVGSTWMDNGSVVALSATPNPGYVFVGWVGTGAGSYTGTQASVSVTVAGPITETASFGLATVVPPATFSLTLTETGLPSSASWSATWPSGGVAGAQSTLIATGLNGSYVVTVPNVYTTSTTRYVANNSGSFTVDVTKNASLSVSFSPEYFVTVVAGAGGAASPASQWAAAGTTIDLSATPAAGYGFSNWTGQGTGAVNSTSASVTLTVTGAVTETANFAPVPVVSSQSNTTVSATGWAILVVLLVVGLLGGVLLGRRRDGSAASAPAGGGSSPAGDDAGSSPPS